MTEQDYKPQIDDLCDRLYQFARTIPYDQQLKIYETRRMLRVVQMELDDLKWEREKEQSNG